VVVGEGEQITDLLVRHGHLWGRHETAIPASAIATLESDAIGLKLSAHDAGQLPSIRARAPGT